MSKPGRNAERVVLAENRKARHEYEILEELEAGIELVGSEVKALRARTVQFADAWAEFRGDQLFLVGLHIAEYRQANQFSHEPTRPRRLLLHRHELDRLRGKVEQLGLTLVPLDIHVSERWIKVRLGLVRGRKTHDKRHAIRDREVRREMDRAIKDHR